MFVKLFQQILDSSIADDRKLRHFFTDLLLCADGEGYVIMTEMAIARRIGASLEEVEWGLAELQKPDPISKTKTMHGRRIEPVLKSGYGWRIINYEHYRAMRDADQLREAVRLRVRKHRAKKADNQQYSPTCNGDVTHGNASNAMQKQNAEAEKDAESKKPARGAWKAAALIEAKQASSVPVPEVLNGIEFIELWRSWCEHRTDLATRNKTAPWTVLAATQELRNIIKAGETHGGEAVLLQMGSAIAGRWQGLNLHNIRPAFKPR